MESSYISEGYMTLGVEAARADSFDVLFSVHHDFVATLAYAMLGNTQDAEDVTQEVFLRVYKALPSYRPDRAGMRTWLATIAVNACRSHRSRNFLRRLRQRAFGDGHEAEGVIDTSAWGAPEAQALQTEIRCTLDAVLSSMRDEHRTVLVLHYYMDISCQEIAQITNCPEGTVYSRLHYARRIVQAQLERRARRSDNEVEL